MLPLMGKGARWRSGTCAVSTWFLKERTLEERRSKRTEATPSTLQRGITTEARTDTALHTRTYTASATSAQLHGASQEAASPRKGRMYGN